MEKVIVDHIDNINQKIIDSKASLNSEILLHGETTLAIGKLHEELGYYQFVAKDYDNARINLGKALEICRPILGDDNEEILDIHYVLSQTLVKVGIDKERGEKYTMKIHALRKAFDDKDPNHLKFIDKYVYIASC